MCDLRDIEWFEIEEDIDVFGISGDSAYAHQEFIRDHNLPFPLLSDYSGDVSRDYGVVYDEFQGHRGVPKRSVFVIDDRREVQYTWLRDDPYEKPDMDALLDAVQELQ